MQVPPEVLTARGHLIPVAPTAPALMGVVNASPESFADGSRYPDLLSQMKHAMGLVEEGAVIVDVGGESGVTGLPPLSPIEEIQRVEPLVRALVHEGVAVSVDTWKIDVAAAVLDAGALMINDVSGLSDPGLATQCANVNAALVIMHTRARPKHKQFPHPSSDATIADVFAFLADRIAVAESLGVQRSQIVIDAGADFGKTPAQTVAVLSRLADLHVFGCPILLAVSRKDFIGAITNTSPAQRLPGTLAAVAFGVANGAGLVRVHDVSAVRDYLKIASALSGSLTVNCDLRLAPELRVESHPQLTADRNPSAG